MKIAVIGAGAIGNLIAGYLKQEDLDITLVGRKETVKKVKEKGLEISGVRGDLNLKIDIVDRLAIRPDLAILAAKTQDLESFLKEGATLLKDELILTTKNGLRADEITARFLTEENIISSIVMFGATYLGDGKVLHNFEGSWIIGKFFSKNDEKIGQIAQLLNKAFPTVLTDDIRGMKYLKLFVNANNCIPGILGLSMQEAFYDINISCIAMQIWKEGLQVINKSGIKLISLPDFPVERLLKLVSLPTVHAAGIYSGIMTHLSKEPLYGSILQSIKRGRPSEIDYLNGEFLRLAKDNKLSVPVNEKIVEMVHQVEKTGKFLNKEKLLDNVKGLVEIVEGKVIDSPFPRIKLTVSSVEGHCYHGYKIGDELTLEDFTHGPKHFCLGLAHALFPVAYALSFGAKFGFMDNQRSLKVTCPDGGKLEFKAEILDNKGKVECIPRDPKHKGPNPKNMIIEVVQAKGKCAYNYKVGDKWETQGLKCISGFCGAAFHCAFPALFALNFGADFFFMRDPNAIDTVTCPDGGNIVFKVTRVEEK